MINKKFHCQKISNFLPSDFQNIDHHEKIKFQFFFHSPYFKNLFVLKIFFQEFLTIEIKTILENFRLPTNTATDQFELGIFTEIFILIDILSEKLKFEMFWGQIRSFCVIIYVQNRVFTLDEAQLMCVLGRLVSIHLDFFDL